jgi:hypothetical protein
MAYRDERFHCVKGPCLILLPSLSLSLLLFLSLETSSLNARVSKRRHMYVLSHWKSGTTQIKEFLDEDRRAMISKLDSE